MVDFYIRRQGDVSRGWKEPEKGTDRLGDLKRGQKLGANPFALKQRVKTSSCVTRLGGHRCWGTECQAKDSDCHC